MFLRSKATGCFFIFFFGVFVSAFSPPNIFDGLIKLVDYTMHPRTRALLTRFVGQNFYKVVKGDSCGKIVDKYGTFGLDDFYTWNPYVLHCQIVIRPTSQKADLD